MALADNALTTVDTVKDDLGITGTEFDSYIERQINVYSEKIEKYCKRRFKKQEYTEKYEGNNTLRLSLKNYPILSVSALTIDTEIVDVNDVIISKNQTNIYYGETSSNFSGKYNPLGFPKNALRAGISYTETNNILLDTEVTYTAGYVLPKDDGLPDPRTLPFDLEQACIDMVSYAKNNRTNPQGVKSRKLLSGSITFGENIPSKDSGLLPSVEGTLIPYIRRGIIV